eukprot:SAG31_NODE_30_length_32545_cov_9.378999_20_plen_152_part_00
MRIYVSIQCYLEGEVNQRLFFEDVTPQNYKAMTSFGPVNWIVLILASSVVSVAVNAVLEDIVSVLQNTYRNRISKQALVVVYDCRLKYSLVPGDMPTCVCRKCNVLYSHNYYHLKLHEGMGFYSRVVRLRAMACLGQGRRRAFDMLQCESC